MFFPSTSTWKMAKYTPNNILDHMIGYDQTSREIHKDGMYKYYQRFILLFHIWYAPVLSLNQIIRLLRGGYYNLNIFFIFSASVQHPPPPPWLEV